MTGDWRSRIRSLLQERKLTMKEASRLAGRGETFVRDILERERTPSTANFEALARVLGVSASELLGELEKPRTASRERIIPIMGYVGAGAEIAPEFEQAPPEGFDQVELPFGLDDAMIGFEVRGDSMFPEYDPGEVIVCYREQRRSTDSYIGKKAVIRTASGGRWLKRIARGPRRGTYNLESWNARTLEGEHIEWVGEIVASVKADGVRHIDRRKPARSKRGNEGRISK